MKTPVKRVIMILVEDLSNGPFLMITSGILENRSNNEEDIVKFQVRVNTSKKLILVCFKYCFKLFVTLKFLILFKLKCCAVIHFLVKFHDRT